jgi:hypothetical protein
MPLADTSIESKYQNFRNQIANGLNPFFEVMQKTIIKTGAA